MRQTSARALLGAAALGIATIAFPLTAAAEPDNASPSATEHCDEDLTKIEGESGSYDGDHGTITWSGDTLSYDLVEGWSLDVCLKAGTDAERSNGLMGAGTVSVTSGKDISYIAYRLEFIGADDGVAGADDGTDDGAGDAGADDGQDDGQDDGDTEVLPDVIEAGDDGANDGADDAEDDDGDVAASTGDTDDEQEVVVEVLPSTLDARLPRTGSDVPALLLAAALALGLGGTALIRARRAESDA